MSKICDPRLFPRIPAEERLVRVLNIFWPGHGLINTTKMPTEKQFEAFHELTNGTDPEETEYRCVMMGWHPINAYFEFNDQSSISMVKHISCMEKLLKPDKVIIDQLTLSENLDHKFGGAISFTYSYPNGGNISIYVFLWGGERLQIQNVSVSKEELAKDILHLIDLTIAFVSGVPNSHERYLV
jgi:hypothetical protein